MYVSAFTEVCLFSGVAGLLDIRVEQKRWQPLTENKNFKKKSQLFIKFPFIFHKNLKFVERRNSKFFLKIFNFPPIGPCSRNGRNACPTLVTQTFPINQETPLRKVLY
jgi:hypothetical protein